MDTILRPGVFLDSAEILPVTAYYRAGRRWQYQNGTFEPYTPQSRFDGYKDWDSADPQHGGFKRWFATMVLAELQENRKLATLGAVRAALVQCIEGVTSVDYRIRQNELLAVLKSGEEMPLQMLSDGYRNMLGIVADLAYRMVVLNPHLEADAIRETPGIVLMDEIDLHLHPKWQRRVVDDLKRTFPKVQFIATTRSPFIIQSLAEGELILLDEDKGGEYVDASIEDITEEIMGVENPQWSQRRRDYYEAAREYFETLDRMKTANVAEREDLRRELDELRKPFTQNVAMAAFLDQKRLVAEHELEHPDRKSTTKDS